ncbi:redoxin family protein [Candidatus Palauibacter sp.]|uniref:redoxin family protein n=1 Tax=Candidatus Palauibacter sp. TaxID=3101350 RepID=UPI003B013710
MNGWWRWALPLAALPVLALLYWGLGQDQRRLPSALEGREAPAFRLANLYEPSDSVSLSDFEGKVVVLNYWASWCIPCISEHPVLVRLRETYDPEEVALIGVLFQDAPENGMRFIEELGGEWPLVTDPGSRTAIEYGVYGVPETYFIGADGVIALRHDLAVTWDLVERNVDSLLVARAAAAPPGS